MSLPLLLFKRSVSSSLLEEPFPPEECGGDVLNVMAPVMRERSDFAILGDVCPVVVVDVPAKVDDGLDDDKSPVTPVEMSSVRGRELKREVAVEQETDVVEVRKSGHVDVVVVPMAVGAIEDEGDVKLPLQCPGFTRLVVMSLEAEAGLPSPASVEVVALCKVNGWHTSS